MDIPYEMWRVICRKKLLNQSAKSPKDEELTQDINESVIHSLIHSCGNVKKKQKKKKNNEIQTRYRIAVYQVRGEEEKEPPKTLCEEINQGFCPNTTPRPTRWAEYTALYSAR